MHGTLTFKSDVPVSAVALRGLINERGEFLITPLPVADVDDWVPASMFFPHFAEGGENGAAQVRPCESDRRNDQRKVKLHVSRTKRRKPR